MCEKNFIARLWKIRETEKELLRDEVALSKATLKYAVSLSKLTERIKAESNVDTNTKRLQHLEATNRWLKTMLETEEAALEKCKQDNLRLQKEYQLSTEQALEEEKTYTAYRQRLHVLHNISNIHINAKALPNVMQGMVICERHKEKHWIPFRFSMNDFNIQQIREILWNLTQCTESYDE